MVFGSIYTSCHKYLTYLWQPNKQLYNTTPAKLILNRSAVQQKITAQIWTDLKELHLRSAPYPRQVSSTSRFPLTRSPFPSRDPTLLRSISGINVLSKSIYPNRSFCNKFNWEISFLKFFHTRSFNNADKHNNSQLGNIQKLLFIPILPLQMIQKVIYK